jgi:intraflagellar transport protein 172
MAFVVLNRFLDLADALDDPEADMSQMENADFADTDVPFDVALPEGPYATEAAREEVRCQCACVASCVYACYAARCISDLPL